LLSACLIEGVYPIRDYEDFYGKGEMRGIWSARISLFNIKILLMGKKKPVKRPEEGWEAYLAK
jgi:hypothetical protein